MTILVLYRKGHPELLHAFRQLGHLVIERAWNQRTNLQQKAEVALFEFKSIFDHPLSFLRLALMFKKAGILTATWNVDAPWNKGVNEKKVQLLLRSGLLDLYATHSLQNVLSKSKTEILHLPNGAFISDYHLKGKTLEDLCRENTYTWDVSFVGNIDAVNYPEHRARVQFLTALKEKLDRLGIRSCFANADLSISEQVSLIQQSRINLSCMGAADSDGTQSWGLPERCYGIPACGGFLLQEERKHVWDDFDSSEVATYQDLSDCVEKILFFLKHPQLRRTIAEKAYQRVFKEHTYEARARKLVAALKQLQLERGK